MFPKELKYAKTHEWVKVDGDLAIVGISDYAQEQLGEVVYVELPEVDTDVKKGDVCASVESAKAVGDVYAPVSGSIVEINQNLEDAPELVNEDPYGAGWLFKIKYSSSDELNELLDADDYQKMSSEEE